MEENEDEISEILIEKIPLEDFIDNLVKLFDNGADYIDLILRSTENKDVITINVREEYMFSEDEEECENQTEISIDDIKDLII